MKSNQNMFVQVHTHLLGLHWVVCYRQKAHMLLASHRAAVDKMAGKRQLNEMSPWFQAFTDRAGEHLMRNHLVASIAGLDACIPHTASFTLQATRTASRLCDSTICISTADKGT